MTTIAASLRNTQMLASISQRFGMESGLFGVGRSALRSSIYGLAGSDKSSGTGFFGSTNLADTLSNYNVEKSNFQTKFQNQMSSLRSATNGLKTLGAAENDGAKAKTASSATASVSNFLKNKALSVSENLSTGNRLSTLRKSAANYSSLNSTDKGIAQNALTRVADTLNRATGIDGETAKNAKNAANVIAKVASGITGDSGSLREKNENALNKITEAVEEYKSTGKVSDTKGLADAISVISDEVEGASSTRQAVDTLENFGQNYKMSLGESADFGAALSSVSDLRDVYSPSEDAVKGASSALHALSNLGNGSLSGDDADNALSSIAGFLSERNSLSTPDSATLGVMKDASDVLTGITQRVAEPYEGLDTLGGLMNNSGNASQSAKSVNESLDAVKNFVNEFNSTVDYMNRNMGLSDRFSNMASSFTDNRGLSQSLKQVGISQDPFGGLTLDENKLKTALTESPGSVETLLGSQGLAGQMEQKINAASSQTEKLFPSVTSYVGSKSFEHDSSFYGSRNMKLMTSYMNMGNFMNMFA